MISHARKRLLVQCHRTRKSDTYVLDKGYDSEDIRRLIRYDRTRILSSPSEPENENESLVTIAMNSQEHLT